MQTLILIPTELEASRLRLSNLILGSRSVVEVCGFGPIGAAIGCCHLIAKHLPQRVLLAGIAGSMSETTEIASAYCFQSVTQQGVGIERSGKLHTPLELGFSQLPFPDLVQTDSIALRTCTDLTVAKQLLTVCHSSDSQESVKRRTHLFPFASAEDMEGYSVALACLSMNVPLMIVRGISNRCGEADKSAWRIDDALQVTREAVLVAEQSDWETPARELS